MNVVKAFVIFSAAAIQLASTSVPGYAQGGPGPMAVRAVTAQLQSFSDRIEALGTLRANETVVLTSTITETVTAVNFEDGQMVEKGDVLVEMTDGEEQAQLQEARSTAEEARRQVDRLKPLIEQGAASKSILDQRQREYETAQARLRAVQSRMKDHLITAPFSGVTGLRNVSLGALVQPGTVIATLDDISIMKLDFTVPSVFLSTLKVGLPVRAKARAFENQIFEGEISAIATQIDPVTRSITVRALIPNPDGTLRPGLLMSVDLFKSERDAIVLPEEALLPEGRDNFVFTIKNSENEEGQIVEKRMIKTGARRPGEVEILEGLQAGEQVVTHGGFKLNEGAAVTVEDSGDQL